MTKTYAPKTKPTLAEAQEMIGGYVTFIVNEPDKQVLCDEDGFAKELDINHEATFVANTHVFGNAIVLRGDAMWIVRPIEIDEEDEDE
jgi:hypothetical protein